MRIYVDFDDVICETAKAVSKWENGKTRPKVQMIRKLAELYQTSPDHLL